MKRYILSLTIASLLFLATFLPAGAITFGVGPPSLELTVPEHGSAQVDFYIFSDRDGEVHVRLENIPLRVEPSTAAVKNTDAPQKVILTFYGDPELGEQTFDGKVVFSLVPRAEEGTMGIGAGVKVRTTIQQTTERASSPFIPTLPMIVGLIAVGLATVGGILLFLRRRSFHISMQ